jgi:hypothetical protein
VGGSPDSKGSRFAIMSYSRSKPIAFGDSISNSTDSLAGLDSSLPFVQAADRAIEAALRSVPLPEGLLNRLKLMVHRMSDEKSDSVDYLGC